jgi:Ca2+-binding RTX toxin-like protein
MGHVPAGSDVEGVSLTYELVAPVAGLTLNADGTFRYAPANHFNGSTTFQYHAVDASRAKSQPQTFTLTVTSVNDAPTSPALTVTSIAENALTGTAVGTLLACDVDGDLFQFNLVDDAGGRFSLCGNQLVVANGALLDFEQAGIHQVTVRVTDSHGASTDQPLTVTVSDVLHETSIGSNRNDRVFGGKGKDMLSAGAGNDRINGGSGDDRLDGGYGKDVLKGGSGRDMFIFKDKLSKTRNLDTISDFSVKDDSLWLDNAIFKKLGSGTPTKPKMVNKAFLTVGEKAKDKNDYLIYNEKKGVLSYDADGAGKAKAVEFAKLAKHLALTEKDFFVI